MSIRIFLAASLFIGVLMIGSVYSASQPENIKLKIVATNSFETEEKTIPAKAYLPEGVTPEDVIDKGEFEINYDTEKNRYFIFQEINLEPGESVTLEVIINNIWVIPNEDLIALNNQVNQILNILQKGQFYNQAKALANSIVSRLVKIAERQDLSGISAEESISNYKTNIVVLAEVKKDVGVLEDLAIQEGGIPGRKLVGETEEDTESVPQDENIDLRGEQSGVIKSKITVYNSRNTIKTVPLKYYLPVEVLPEYLLDKGGLEVAYDYNKGRHYVYKDNIEMLPSEKKEFTISIKDVWTISEARIEILKTHAEKLMNILIKSEYNELAAALVKNVLNNLSSIEELQDKTDIPVDARIGNYRLNSIKYINAKKEIAKLERLVIQAGGSPGITMLTKDIKYKEGGVIPAGGEKLTDEEYGETLRETAKWVEIVGKSIFRGKSPSSTTTWKIIYTIVIFLGVLSVMVFVIFLLQQRISQLDPLTGTSNRHSIDERIKQTFKVSVKTQRKFSLLLIDIDKFKEINDKYGHSTGDLVLKEFVILVRKAIRQNDLLGRMGGDEFLVVLSGAEKDKACAIAERIRGLVEDYKVKLQDEFFQLTASVGIATYPDDTSNLQELLNKVDNAMYAVKDKGGNGIMAV